MRRALGVVVVVALMAVSTAAMAGSATQSYKDIFPGITYSGSAGSLLWKDPWLEIGENDGPDDGDVFVNTGDCFDYKCLQIEGDGSVGMLGAERYADTSFFVDAELCFDVNASLDDDGSTSTGELLIQVTVDGSKWTTIDKYGFQNLNQTSRKGQKGLNNYLATGFGVRFVATGELFGEVYIDNVEIKGSVASSSTTTTAPTGSSTSSTSSTTKPKIATTTTEKITTTTTEQQTTTTRPQTSTSVETTTTTTGETTTTVALVPAGPTDPPPESGLRMTPNGVQANFSSELFGAMQMEKAEVLGAEFDANYSMAVEVFSASWVWIVALLLLIVTAVITGLDRRRTDRGSAAA